MTGTILLIDNYQVCYSVRKGKTMKKLIIILVTILCLTACKDVAQEKNDQEAVESFDPIESYKHTGEIAVQIQVNGQLYTAGLIPTRSAELPDDVEEIGKIGSHTFLNTTTPFEDEQINSADFIEKTKIFRYADNNIYIFNSKTEDYWVFTQIEK